jgi:hypothetical protein
MIQGIIIIGMIIALLLFAFQEYFFGEKELDDRQGFPWSRRHRK